MLGSRGPLAALLYLEWLGLTAPEQDILATPELMALVRKRPPWSYESYSSFQLYFTDRILTQPCWVRLYNMMRPAPRLTGVPVAACSQAHVFPAAWARRLADYLHRHTEVPKDIATDRLARADGLQTHLVQPLLFQHVGTYSVILHYEKNPANVVSAGFSV